MTDSQRKSIGSIRRLWNRVEPKQPLNHQANLSFVRPPVTSDRSLDLTGRVQRNRKPAPGRACDRNGSGLSRPHDCSDVVLAEHALNGNRIRIHFIEHLLDPTFNSQESSAQFQIGWGANHTDANEGEFASGCSVNDAEPTSG